MSAERRERLYPPITTTFEQITPPPPKPRPDLRLNWAHWALGILLVTLLIGLTGEFAVPTSSSSAPDPLNVSLTSEELSRRQITAADRRTTIQTQVIGIVLCVAGMACSKPFRD